MIPRVWGAIALAGLLTVNPVGCSHSTEPPAKPYEIYYEWIAGSIPPPGHYRYRVYLRSDGTGTLVYIPGYIGRDTPHWNQDFDVSRTKVRELYRAVKEHDFQEQPTREIGGSRRIFRLSVGTEDTIDREILEPSESTQALKNRIRNLVPDSLWEHFERRHEHYRSNRTGP